MHNNYKSAYSTAIKQIQLTTGPLENRCFVTLEEDGVAYEVTQFNDLPGTCEHLMHI